MMLHYYIVFVVLILGTGFCANAVFVVLVPLHV